MGSQVTQVTLPEDIRRLGTILSVWAHPDDETFLAAGIMATAVKNSQKVVCVTATRGEAGSQNIEKWPLASLAETRTRELKSALRVLGVKEHHWLGYHDGECRAVNEAEAVKKITDLILAYRPDTLVTFGPEGMTGHPDHQIVSKWCRLAAHNASSPLTTYHAVHTKKQYDRYLKEADDKFNIFFNIDQPPLKEESECTICYELSPAIRRLKRNALAAMPSQTEAILQAFDEQFLDAAFAKEYFVAAPA